MHFQTFRGFALSKKIMQQGSSCTGAADVPCCMYMYMHWLCLMRKAATAARTYAIVADPGECKSEALKPSWLQPQAGIREGALPRL